MKKKTKFRIVAILLPFAALFLLEMLLRLLGAGHDLSFFKEETVGSTVLVRPNPQAMRRYYPPSYKKVPGVHDFVFEKKKPAGRKRVFVFGASTVQGFPYGPNLAFPTFLQELCRANNRDVEVINLGVTSATSRIILRQMGEALRYRPDVVVILMGHNEFYGPGGAASSLAAAPTRLRELRIYQLLEGLLTSLFPGPQKKASLLQRLSQERAIALDSPVFKRTLQQFRNNLQNMRDRLRTLPKTRVIVFSPPSNLRDFPPGNSNNPPRMKLLLQQYGLDFQKKKTWEKTRIADELIGRLQGYQKSSADSNYLHGKWFLAANPNKEVTRLMRRARDLDRLRLRAPGELVRITKKLAWPTQKMQFVFIDTDRLLDPDLWLPGDTQITEYIHPTYRSHRKIALALYGTVFGRQAEKTRFLNYTYVDLIAFRKDILAFFRDFLLPLNGYVNFRCLEDDFEIVKKGKAVHVRIPDSKKQYRFVENIKMKIRSNSELHRLAAQHFLQQGDTRSAWLEYRAGLVLHQDNQVFLNNLLVLAGEHPRGEMESGEYLYRLETWFRPDQLLPAVLGNLRLLAEKRGDQDRAQRYTRLLQQLHPQRTPQRGLRVISL